MDIVFVRHGRTKINQEGRYGGYLDIEISIEGIGDIKKAREFLKDIDFDCVYSSPLKRALQSAETLGVECIKDERLMEMNFGIFEGLNYSEMCKRYPKESKEWENDYINYRIPLGESLNDIYERTVDFIESLDKNHKRVLVITHGGIIGCALCYTFSRREDFFKFKILHGSASVISINKNFSYIKGINCTGELKRLL